MGGPMGMPGQMGQMGQMGIYGYTPLYPPIPPYWALFLLLSGPIDPYKRLYRYTL